MNKNKIAVIGLGYVGLPVSVLFSTKYKVIGYDINVERIKSLNNFNDTTEELLSKDIKKALKKNLSFSNDRDSISDCNIYKNCTFYDVAYCPNVHIYRHFFTI